MSETFDFRLVAQDGTMIELHGREYDGVETTHSRVFRVDLPEARSLHATLGEAIQRAEANDAVLRDRRRQELVDRRGELERQIHAIDAEIG